MSAQTLCPIVLRTTGGSLPPVTQSDNCGSLWEGLMESRLGMLGVVLLAFFFFIFSFRDLAESESDILLGWLP